QDKRDAMRQAADEVADKLKVDRGQIEFRWPEQLEGEVNLHPNVIPVHLPHVASPLTDVVSLQQWGRDLELTGCLQMSKARRIRYEHMQTLSERLDRGAMAADPTPAAQARRAGGAPGGRFRPGGVPHPPPTRPRRP